ncbi:MAG TPA: transglutaminase family protein [Thermoplasmatales archaeon]|nr:transglutaminase family protein [Thermoplasmatales archaeon]
MKWLREMADKGDIIPPALIKNFLKTLAPLSYVIARNPKAIIKNMDAWKKRLKISRAPWAHIDDESEYDSVKLFNLEENGDLPVVSDEKYLRPTRMCECDSVEIRAMAKKLGAYEKEPIEYVKSIFYFVKNQKYLVFKPMVGALGVLKSKGGVCLDQMNLLIALARAGGIKARYRLYALSPSQEMYDVMVKDDPILRETYEILGFLDSLHGCAEIYVDGEWLQLDPTLSDELEAGMGLPIAEFGEEPAWRVRVPERDIVFEGFPVLFQNMLILTALILRNTVDMVNKKLDDLRVKGRRILEEVGKEEYNKTKKQFKIDMPSLEEIKKFREKALVQRQI